MKDSVLKFFLIFSIIFSNAQYKEWEDLSTFKINTEEPHSFYIPKDINGDSVTKSLNGTWSFKLFKNDELVPKDFYKIDFNILLMDIIPESLSVIISQMVNQIKHLGCTCHLVLGGLVDI